MLVRKVAFGAVCALLCVVSIPAFAQSFTGPYIRGDVGWSGSTDANIHDRNFALDGAICGNAACTVPGQLNDVGHAWFLGVGVGAQFAPAFRGDVVYSYRGGYQLSDTDQGSPLTAFGADIASHSLMANVYWDVPLGGGAFAPFVGGGIGWAHNRIGNVSGTSSGVTSFVPGGSNDNFAWQLMAGVGFAVGPRTKLDAFYRYFDGGHIETDAGNVVQGGSVVGTYSGFEGRLHAHELGLSLRFAVGG
jgi:opacity protein-like surface antigen